MARQMVYGNDDSAYIDHRGMVHETQKGSSDEGAILFVIKGKKVWVPKKLIKDHDDTVVIVQKWWAEKNGLESDW